VKKIKRAARPATKKSRKANPSKATPRIPVRGDARKKPKPRADAFSARRSGVRSRELQQTPTAAAAHRDLPELRALALEAMDAALDKKALMPVLIDVSGLASYTDFIGIVSGRSDRQVDAIADNIIAFMKSRGRHVLGQEGSGGGRWTLLDFGSIVVHVFYHPVREFYDLESLWIEAPRVKMEIPPESMLTQPDALYGAL
jgi:ribosome-associated protein